MSTIGTITIGQSPRSDILPDFEAALGRKLKIVQRGALDNLSLAEVRQLAPREGDYVLVTRMRDGSEVKIAERHISTLMKNCVAELEQADVDLIVLFCTGEFPELVSRKLIVKPDVLLENVLRGLLSSGGRLAAVVPSPDQIPALGKRWGRVVKEPLLEAVSPYTGSQADFEAVAGRLAARAPDLIVLDCMGFSEKIKAIFQKITGKPVILPRSLLGRVVGELAG
jgi:protein AroM